MTIYDPELMTRHPEGGAFREVFRSVRRVVTTEFCDRSAVTHIYFSLGPREVSVFHRVVSDEIWHLYAGDGVMLYTFTDADTVITETELSASSRRYCHVVPSRCWQAARPISGEVLVGCTVAPGFEFADFELMRRGDRRATLVETTIGGELLGSEQ